MNLHSVPSPAPRSCRPERLRARRLRAAFALFTASVALLLGGCGGVLIKPADQVPPPLVDELPLRAGVHYGAEFREYVHREERWGTKWEVQLGGAHLTKLNRLLRAMFPNLVEVADRAQPPQPPLDLILEPRFEEYSFVTPRDAGADYYAVTIKYRMNVHDGAGRLIDSLVYTGYGNVEGGGLSSEKPLVEATQKAMRDAGAKFATEFDAQPSIRTLLAGGKVEPIAPGAPATGTAAGGIGEVEPTPPEQAAPVPTAPASSGPVAPAPAAPTGSTPPGEQSATAAPAAPPADAPASGAPSPAEPSADAAPADTPPAIPSPTGEPPPASPPEA